MSSIENQVATSSGVSKEFFNEAKSTLLNLGSSDADILKFLEKTYSSDNQGDGVLQTINYLMNMRNQRSSMLSNIEDKRHNGAMSIISNMK